MRHKYTLTIGRTHGVHAEPTTFGHKLAVFVAQVRRNCQRLEHARDELRVGKISGAVGTHANVPAEVEERALAELGLASPPKRRTQILQRDRHAQFVATLAVIGATLEQQATEIRLAPAHRSRRGVRAVRQHPAGLERHAAQAQPGAVRARVRPGAGCCAATP